MKKSILKLDLKFKNGKTIIEDSYFTAPLKILKPFYSEDNKKMRLCLLNVSAGVLEGDKYNIDINVAKECNLYLYSQAYNKIFKMRGGLAAQKFNVNMEEGSSFAYMPMPNIPFIDSNYINETNIRLKKNCNLILREIISCGRYKNNEVFDFLNFSSRTKIFYEDKLVFMDNTVLKPKEQNLKTIGLYEKYDHQANMIIFSKEVNEELKEILLKLLSKYENIDFGISQSFYKGMIIRILGRSSEELRNITDEMYEVIS